MCEIIVIVMINSTASVPMYVSVSGVKIGLGNGLALSQHRSII